MLTHSFKKTLATKAHQLPAIIIVGVKGLTFQVHQEIDAALTAHELIKIRVNASSRELRQEMKAQIAEHHNATVIQNIGHIIVLFRSSR